MENETLVLPDASAGTTVNGSCGSFYTSKAGNGAVTAICDEYGYWRNITIDCSIPERDSIALYGIFGLVIPMVILLVIVLIYWQRKKKSKEGFAMSAPLLAQFEQFQLEAGSSTTA